MLKVGIIGSGFGLYGLLPAFSKIKNCRVVSICGEETDRLLTYCQSIGLKNIYTNWKVMLGKEELDAIAIAVTPKAQYQIATSAMQKGINIFAEKPLTATYPQALELFNLAKRKKITTMIDFIFPEIVEWKKVKQLIDKKTYGGLNYISANWDFLSFDIKYRKSTWKTKVSEGGGALSFYFSHSLYYLEYFAGEISDLKSLLTYSKESINGGEVSVDLLLKFKKGILGHTHLSCNTGGLNKHQLIFNCDHGTIILENENSITENFSIKIYTNEGIKQLTIPKKQAVKKDEDERVAVIKKLADKFVNACIRRKFASPSFKDGLRVQELIEKIRLKQL